MIRALSQKMRSIIQIKFYDRPSDHSIIVNSLTVVSDHAREGDEGGGGGGEEERNILRTHRPR